MSTLDKDLDERLMRCDLLRVLIRSRIAELSNAVAAAELLTPFNVDALADLEVQFDDCGRDMSRIDPDNSESMTKLSQKYGLSLEPLLPR